MSSDRNEDSLEKKEAESIKQHTCIIPLRHSQQLPRMDIWLGTDHFVARRRGAIVKDNFYGTLERYSVFAGKRD